MISVLTQAEADAAIELWAACGLTLPWNDARSDLELALAGPSSTVLAHHSGEPPVLDGTAMVGHDGHRAWVYYLAVAPNLQGRGLGRILMDAAERWARDQGLPKIQLMVRTDNNAVREFYAHLGYELQDVVVLGRRF